MDSLAATLAALLLGLLVGAVAAVAFVRSAGRRSTAARGEASASASAPAAPAASRAAAATAPTASPTTRPAAGSATGSTAGSAAGSATGSATGSAAGSPARSVTEPGPDAVESLADRVLEVIAVAAIVVDSGDDVVLANAAARALGVVRGRRLIARQLLDLTREVRRGPRAGDAVLTAELATGSAGTPQILGAQAIPLALPGRVALILQDVTEARRVELVRRDFVANVSHELKTPVGALTLLAEAVQDAADDPEAVRRFAGRMQHEGDRLGHLVAELIDLSRLQGGDPMPPLATVAVDDVVSEACDRARLAADAKGIELVASGSGPLTVLGVEAQVVTALTNMLANAVAYSPEGTKVAIGYRERAGYAEIAVTDEGVGIPQDDLTRVFERFYRVDPARSSATGGTGLGLAIVKHIATNHGGSVQVWSEEGRGSTFTLRLPAADANRFAASGPAVPVAEPTPPLAEPAPPPDSDPAQRSRPAQRHPGGTA